MDNYDKTKEYTKYVKPIVSELKKECGLNNIPFLFTAAIKNSERCSWIIKNTRSRNGEIRNRNNLPEVFP